MVNKPWVALRHRGDKHMNISFRKTYSQLILDYSPDYGFESLRSKLDKGEEIVIKHSFFVQKADETTETSDEHIEDSFSFVIGSECGDYYMLDKQIINTEHTFCFAKDIPIVPQMFVAHRNISILRKIDMLISRDVYIGGYENKDGFFPLETFKRLLTQFPNSTEIDKYARARVAQVLRNYFDEVGNVDYNFQRYLDKKTIVLESRLYREAVPIKLAIYKSSLKLMEEMLNSADGYAEKQWQTMVCDIVRLIYPKYILAKREVCIRGVDNHDKRPDFTLIDAGGFVDILEIKKPDKQRIITTGQYRNNYVPDRDLSGAIVQIEKYVYCLSHWGSSGEKALTSRFETDLPKGVSVRIVNPQGMLILGRSSNLTEKQKYDFEIVKRQYKNIVDIMTYDDLLERLKNIVSQLERQR